MDIRPWPIAPSSAYARRAAQTSRSLRVHQWLGLFLALLLFGGLGGWASATVISGAVIAQARVVVETNPKKLQHVEGGIVAEILTTDGARVEAGQTLLRLDQTETRANLAVIKAQLDDLLARQARLQAERDRTAEIAFPAEITGRLDDAYVQNVHTGQRHLFVARREAREGEQDQLRYKIEQLSDETVGLEAQRKSKERQLALTTSELTGLKSLQDQGLVRLNRILALERELARLEGERGSLTAQIASKRGEIGETRLRIIQIDKDLSSEVIKELREAQTKIVELMEKRLAAETRLKHTEIRAPRSGIVHQLSVHTVGGVVTAGEPIMLIVPEQDALIFEAHVSPSDIDQVQVGQRTMIRLHAFDPGLTPEIIGKVLMISPDSITETQTSTPYYLVRIQVTEEGLAKLGRRVLVPGMLAEAFIETQPRTVLSYLLKPLSERIAHVFRER
jgi:HlyD family secretion protein